MPIYEYECGACGDNHEFIQKFSEGPKRKCPSCGKMKLKKLVSAAAFHLKGTGWYVTDFRDGGKGAKGGADKGGDKSESSGSSESASAKSDGASTKSDSAPGKKDSSAKSDSPKKGSGSKPASANA